MGMYRYELRSVEESVYADLMPAGILSHVDWFLANTPDRLCTSAGCWQAMDYILERMRDYGLRTEVQEFFGYNSTPAEGRLVVLEPEYWEVPAVAVGYGATAWPEGVEGHLVDVGGGGPHEYPGSPEYRGGPGLQLRKVEGSVVLARLSYAPPAPEKARLAAEHGAVGLVLVSWGRPGDEAISRRAIKGVWGNPTPADVGKIPALPVVAISRNSGARLERLLANGPVKVRLWCRSSREWISLRQPLAHLEGTGERDDFVLVSGHLDSWIPGATDNANGNALMLELARALARHQPALRRSLVFAFWTGHEVMEATGSTWYADTMWDSLRDHAVAYLNIDSPGLVGTEYAWCLGSREFWPFLWEVGETVLPDVPMRVTDVGRYADQSFRGVGVPAIIAWTGLSDEEVRQTGGAILGWWNHTEFDTRDKIDVPWMMRLARLYVAYVIQLASQPLLPLDYRPLVRKLEEGLVAAAAATGKSLPSLSRLVEAVRECYRAVSALQELRDALARQATGSCSPPVDQPLPPEMRRVNNALKKLGRVLSPVAYTVGGKYAQDPYGLCDAAEAIPPFVAVRKLSEVLPGSDEQRLLLTQALRERNLLSDAIDSAAQIATTAVSEVRSQCRE